MARESAVKQRGPAQKRVLDNDVILLRKVNFKKLGPGLTDVLRNTSLRPGEPEGDMPWFLDGYIAAEQPRDYMVSRALLDVTRGFAIARTDNGEILAEFATADLPRAADIASKAKVEMAVGVLLNEGDKPSDDEDDEQD